MAENKIVFQYTPWSANLIIGLTKDDPTFSVDWGSWGSDAFILGDPKDIKELFQLLEPDFTQRDFWIRLERG